MIKQVIGRVASEVLFFLGDLASRPMERFDWGWLYPTYNYLMNTSHRLQLWAGNDKPWGKYEQD